MPSTLKRPSLGRLLASLRPPPSRAGSQSSFPVQTGFPTSLADLVVKNHGRLRRSRKQRSPSAALAPPPSPPPVALKVAAEEVTLSPPTQPLSPVAVRRVDASPRTPRGAAAFRLGPELLAAGGAVSLALLAVWSEGTVAAFTVAALSLLWIESATRRRQRPTETNQAMALLLDSCARGPVSPIREADDEAAHSSCSDSDKGSDEVVAGGGGGRDDRTTPKRKAKRRSLRKLISKKLQKKPSSNNSLDSSCSFERSDADRAQKTESLVLVSTEQTASESSIEWSSSSESVAEGRGPGVKFPQVALAPVILAGLAVGKLPATVLAVLCIVFSSAVQRL